MAGTVSGMSDVQGPGLFPRMPLTRPTEANHNRPEKHSDAFHQANLLAAGVANASTRRPPRSAIRKNSEARRPAGQALYRRKTHVFRLEFLHCQGRRVGKPALRCGPRAVEVRGGHGGQLPSLRRRRRKPEALGLRRVSPLSLKARSAVAGGGYVEKLSRAP